VMVEPVPKESVSSYGVADVAGHQMKAGDSRQMTAVVEKPAVEDAPSNLAVVGRYVFSADIWPLLKRTPVGAGNEIQLTDAIAMLMQQQQVNAYHIRGRSHDCGNKLGYISAFVEYALRDQILGEDVKTRLQALLS
jgi:UTP--glucose-1-phosphate uridylyltransferase